MGGFAANIGAHWWVILIIVVLIFGATRLPQLARGIGQSINVFKREVREGKDEREDQSSSPSSSTDAK